MHACQKRYLSSQHIYHTLFGHLSWPTVTRVSSHQLGWRLHEGDDFHPQENIDKMANGEPLTDQVSPSGGVSAADTECQSFTEPLFCHVNDGGDSTDRTQQVSQRCYIWADGKSSRHKDLSSEPKLLCSFEGFTAACFNLYLFSFLLTVKLKRGDLQMVRWSAANVRMLAVKLAAVCFQLCLMINLSLCGRITGTVVASARFKYAQHGSLRMYS